MNYAARTITKENFLIFKTLINELLLKATDLDINSYQLIDSQAPGTDVTPKFLIPENKAQEIADKIIDTLGAVKIGSRRLQTLINAALNNNYEINTRIYTLNIIVQYVGGITDQNDTVSYWQQYLVQHRDLLPPRSINDTNEHEPNLSSESRPTEEKFPVSKITLQYEFTADADHQIYLRAGLRGGALAGLVSAILVTLFRYLMGNNLAPISTGYENMTFSIYLTKLFPILMPLQIFCGCILGAFCRMLVYKKKRLGHAVLFAIICFIFIVILRQLMARDALYEPGTYISKNPDGTLRFGGGYLGEPDFETIATGVMGTLSIFVVASSLRKNKAYIFSGIKTIIIILKAIIIGIIGWCSIFVVYHLLLRLGLITHGQVLFSRDIFVVDFPHPERPIMYCSLGLIYILCLLSSFRLHFKHPELINV